MPRDRRAGEATPRREGRQESADRPRAVATRAEAKTPAAAAPRETAPWRVVQLARRPRASAASATNAATVSRLVPTPWGAPTLRCACATAAARDSTVTAVSSTPSAARKGKPTDHARTSSCKRLAVTRRPSLARAEAPQRTQPQRLGSAKTRAAHAPPIAGTDSALLEPCVSRRRGANHLVRVGQRRRSRGGTTAVRLRFALDDLGRIAVRTVFGSRPLKRESATARRAS